MHLLINKIRNKLESSRFSLSLLNVLAKNWAYKKYIYYVFQKKLKLIEDKRQYSIAIEVSSFCNGKCFFCPNQKMKRQKNIMGMDIFLKIIERIKEEKISPTQFNLTGTGEPLIDKDLFKKIKLLKKFFPDVKVFFPTNLALASVKLQKKILDSGLDNISVSLNANNANDYRKIMGLDYKSTIKNLNSLINLKRKRKSNLKIYLKLAANPQNMASIDDFIKKWKDKVDGIGVSWIHSWAGAIDNNESGAAIPRYPCRSLFEQIVIHSNGNIPLCCVDYEGEIVGGNVLNDSILESCNGLKIKKIKLKHKRGQISQIKMCSQCRFSERGLHWLAG